MVPTSAQTGSADVAGVAAGVAVAAAPAVSEVADGVASVWAWLHPVRQTASAAAASRTGKFMRYTS